MSDYDQFEMDDEEEKWTERIESFRGTGVCALCRDVAPKALCMCAECQLEIMGRVNVELN